MRAESKMPPEGDRPGAAERGDCKKRSVSRTRAASAVEQVQAGARRRWVPEPTRKCSAMRSSGSWSRWADACRRSRALITDLGEGPDFSAGVCRPERRFCRLSE